jgi:hypothetical protein
VFEHVLEGMPDAFAELDDSDPAVLSAVARIRRECTEAKEALSSDTEVSIPVLLPSSRGSVRLHRSEFEAMIGPQVEDTVAALRSAVISAGFAPDQLSAVLLVGGSSRIPLVAQLVSEQLGRPVAVDADPKNAIAKGAALSLAPQPAAMPAGAPAPGMPPGPPPARPPRMAPPPPGMPGMPYSGPYNEGPYNDGPGTPPHGDRPGPGHYGAPARPAPEPAAAMLTEPAPRQARHAHQRPEPEWDYDDDREPDLPERRRPNVMAIGLGAVLAVGAVVLAIVLWQNMSGTPTDPAGNESTLGVTSAPSESGESGSGGGGRGSGGDEPAPVAPPAGDATSAPETSAAEEPPAATKTTTKASEPTKGGSNSTKNPDSSSDSESDSSGDSDSESGGSEGDSNAAGPVGDVEEVEPAGAPAAPSL